MATCRGVAAAQAAAAARHGRSAAQKKECDAARASAGVVAPCAPSVRARACLHTPRACDRVAENGELPWPVASRGHGAGRASWETEHGRRNEVGVA